MYGLLTDHITSNFFKGCIPQFSLGLFLNTSSYIWYALISRMIVLLTLKIFAIRLYVHVFTF